MNKKARVTCLCQSLGFSVSALAFVFLSAVPSWTASAQQPGTVDPTQSVNWAAGAIAHAQQMRRYKDADQGSQLTPRIIPKFEIDGDPSGRIGTFQPNSATIT